MAIDSAAKRASIVAIGLCAIGPSVIPDGSFDQADRQTVGYGYYGILSRPPGEAFYETIRFQLNIQRKIEFTEDVNTGLHTGLGIERGISTRLTLLRKLKALLEL